LAFTKIRYGPETAVYIAKQRDNGKTKTRSDPLPHASFHPPHLRPPARSKQHPNHDQRPSGTQSGDRALPVDHHRRDKRKSRRRCRSGDTTHSQAKTAAVKPRRR
jgi:hypothetical protein